jgi:hypothetical protein
VLDNIGWAIHKVWSVEWYRNPERELQRLVTAIETAKAQTSLDDQVEEELELEINALIREEKKEITTVVQRYTQAVLPAGLPAQELHLVPFGKLAEWIRQVVDIESPVHFEEVARRIADASGASKIGSRIRYTLNAATDFAVNSKIIARRGDFLWHSEMTEPTLRERSGLTPGSRKINLISPEEMDIAVKNVVESSIAIQQETAVPLIAKLFGINRVTEDVRKELSGAIDLTLARGIVVKDGDYLKVQ